jgi:2-oxoglutarate dehydrogenase E1 component
MDDAGVSKAQEKKIRRVILCTGKVYYDLLEQQRTGNHTDVAIVRLEQLYPFPADQLHQILDRYAKAELVWVQEEPINMGAWVHVKNHLEGRKIHVVGRRATASTATGFKKVHDQQQANLVASAFANGDLT